MAGSQQDEMNLQEIEDEIIVEEAVQEIIDYIVENDVTSDTDEESTTTCNVSGQCSINFGFNTYYTYYNHTPNIIVEQLVVILEVCDRTQLSLSLGNRQPIRTQSVPRTAGIFCR
ncbi:unnamed protein product [Macrosiphum euphorbiae]|uniref:Uncharacterized protein n=1 Tax=Macrosiphum euphorbiae TaxID=13131 RepID=A0AAV0XSP7_9HEMI|nr:unnamed protein product [Macrosiphum euphorbiae]